MLKIIRFPLQGEGLDPIRIHLSKNTPCHCEERSDVAIRTPYVPVSGIKHGMRERIATPAFGLARNDIP